MQISQKTVEAVGSFGMVMAFVLTFAYADQIALNWAGKTGSFWQPASMVVNCAAWSFYGLFTPKRNWKIALPNLAGVVFGAVTAWTAMACAGTGCHF